MKRGKKALILIGCVLCTLFLIGIERYLVETLSTQQFAGRWSKEEPYAQLSCYFTREAGFYPEQIIAVQRNLVSALEEAAMTGTKENGGRNWVDAYSTQTELTIFSNRANVTVRAFGVGGDFFWFHPLTLLDGNYFDASDENADGVILDEVTAWQLFGSNHVSGMKVEINGAVYPIRGVVRSDVGMFSDAVEEERATIYVSHKVLTKMQEEAPPIDCYEVLIANPVKEFGKNALKNAVGIEESEYELVENSARYDLLHRIDVIKNFGVRSMRTKNIVFPYWENRARGYEDVSALFLVLEVLCISYPLYWSLQKCKYFWQNKQILLKKIRKTDKVNRKKQKKEA